MSAALKRPRSGSDRRRRRFVTGDHSASLPNRCFTGGRITQAAADIVSTSAEGPFFHAAKREARSDRPARARTDARA
jgi:hypothetical protein